METSRGLWRLSRALLTVVAFLRFRVTVERSGTVPDGATLLCGKHSSWFDIFLLGRFAEDELCTLPRYQMGSFVGYRALGVMVPLLRRLGGFCVMRPKEARRLKRLGSSKDEALARMKAVNAAAEEERQRTLRRGGALIYFPEGTRDDRALRPLASPLELASAVTVAAAGTPVTLWPVMLRYGPRRGLRRRPVHLHALPPRSLEGESADELLAFLEHAFTNSWGPASGIVAPDAPTRVLPRIQTDGEP